MTKIDIEAMEDEIDDIVFDATQENKTRQEAVKELLDLFLVSCCFRVQKKFDDGINYFTEKEYFSKHKHFADVFTKTDAERVAKKFDAEIELYYS